MRHQRSFGRHNFENSRSYLLPPNTINEELEVVKLLFHDTNTRMQNLRERSFKTAIQTVTLNLIALGGLIANKVALTYTAKILGSSLLASFNVAIIVYMYFKGTAFGRANAELVIYKQELLSKSSLVSGKIKLKQPGAFSFWSGSGILMLAITVSGICGVLALWFQLISAEQKEITYKTPPQQTKAVNNKSSS